MKELCKLRNLRTRKVILINEKSHPAGVGTGRGRPGPARASRKGAAPGQWGMWADSGKGYWQ